MTFSRLMLVCFVLPLAQAQIFDLPAVPTAEQLQSAKAAFESGSIVVTELPDSAKFASIFNFPLPSLPSGHRPKPPCIMAAVKDAGGKVKTFSGSNVELQPAVTPACSASFNTWVQAQSLLGAAPITGWTHMSDLIPGPQLSPMGNQVEIKGSIYRANSPDVNNDYYLLLLSAQTTVVGDFVPTILDMQASLRGVRGTSSPIVDFGPDTKQQSFSIGANLPFSPGINGTYSQSGLNPGYFNGSPANGSGEWTYYQAEGQNPGVLSQAAMIVNLPAGTGHFTPYLNATALFSSPSKGSDKATYVIGFPQTAPFLFVPAETYVTRGQQASIPVSASRSIAWTITGSPTFTTQNEVIRTGPATFSFMVNSDAPLGTSGDFSFNTVPPSATAQVPISPVPATVYVNSTLPPSGVLLAGGQDWDGVALATAQVWNPTTGTLDSTNRAMVQARYQHTATLILSGANNPNNGRVLVAGGFGSDNIALATTELFDPTTGQFTPGPAMSHAHAAHQTVRLNNGYILVIGGVDETKKATAIVEVYNPFTNSFGSPIQLVKARQNFTATLISDGSVLVAGGSGASDDINTFADAELYDPEGQTFDATPKPLTVPRQAQAAVRLVNDQVVILGGFTNTCSPCDPLTSSEIYTPGSSQPFAQTTGSLAPGRRYEAAVDYTSDGTQSDKVAIIGGYNYADWITTYDPVAETFTNLMPMKESRDHPTAVLLQGTNGPFDGQILIAGGVLPSTGSSEGRRLELYNPADQTVNDAGTMNIARSGLTTTLFGLSTSSLPAQRRVQ